MERIKNELMGLAGVEDITDLFNYENIEDIEISIEGGFTFTKKAEIAFNKLEEKYELEEIQNLYDYLWFAYEYILRNR